MIEIPDKLYFKIGEVARITKVKPHVLRYWEGEFKIITPKKSGSKQRVYTRRDVALIVEIQRLLQKEKFTIEGAKKRLKNLHLEKDAKTSQLAIPYSEERYQSALKAIKKELDVIRKMLTPE